MSLKSKLNRLKPHISLDRQGDVVHSCLPAAPASVEVPFIEKWKQENVVPYYLDQDYCLIREVSYPLSYQHGHYCFRDLLTAIEMWNNQTVPHPLSAAGHHAEELFFFDTETTGLGGGVGNTIFLLGYASVSKDQLILRQHILPHPGAEVALYQSFLEKVNYKTLVTYNGKSFDWPQVKTRHTLVREHVPKLPAFGHFDLYHASRRLWKHKLDRLKLAVVEKEILGVERVDDVPGYLAPMIYFDFIESKQPDGILGILKHNELDILSLVTLYAHLTFQLHGTDKNQTRPESYEVARWFASLGEKREAEKVLAPLVSGNDFTSFQAKLALGYQYKKQQEWTKARDFFLNVVDSDDERMRLEACLELTKIYEHRIKDYDLAIKYCQQAISLLLQTNKTFKLSSEITREQFQKRLERVQGKMAKFYK